MGLCEIRLAKYEDIDSIMKYINDYWRNNHILAINRKLFEWQYIHYDKVTMAIAEDSRKQIKGLLGYVPYDNTDNADIVLALWKANSSEEFLGIRLLLFIVKYVPHRNIICPGINWETTSKIYSSIGMNVGIMKQWYRLNARGKYTIGLIRNRTIPAVAEEHEYTLNRIRSFSGSGSINGLWENCTTPRKSKSYFEHRYFSHPIYEYFVYLVCDDNRCSKGILVLRIQEAFGERVFRFVDFVGDVLLLSRITPLIDEEMKRNNVEYIDMYETGVDDDLLSVSGWMQVKNSGNIIPNYFAPYEQKVVDICYCSSDSNAIIFRGDGDQDRPN